MTRQVTDQLYIDLDYFTPEEYLVYTAEAEVNVSSQSSVTCEFGKIQSAESAMTVTTTIVAYGARDRDIDMFAFSEAALAIQANSIVDANIQLTSVFDIATDATRFRDVSAEEDSFFDFTVVNERSRATSMETQTAFSFDVSYDRIRNDSFAATTSTDLFVVISHIEGADIVISDFATLTVDAFVNKGIIANLNAVTSTNIVTNVKGNIKGQLKSYTSIFVSRYAGTGRPVTLTGSFDSNNLINSSTRISNLSNLSKVDNWNYHTNIFIHAPNGWDSISSREIFYMPLGSTSTGNCYAQVVFTYGSGGVGYLFVNLIMGNYPYYATGYASETLISNFYSASITIAFTGGQKASVYVNGTRVGVYNDVPTTNWIIPSSNTVRFGSGFPAVLGSRTHNLYTNYAWLTLDDYTGGGASTISYTTPDNTPNTVFLYEFNGNGQETLGLNQTGSAALTTTTSLVGGLGGPVRANAALTSTTNLTAKINRIQEIELIAFDDAELTIEATRIHPGSVQSEITSTLDATALRIQPSEINTSAETSLSVTVDRIRDDSISTNADTTLSADTFQYIGIVADIDSNFYVDRTYYESGYIEQDYYEQFLISANVITDITENIQSSFTLTADPDSTSSGAVLIVSAATLSVDFSKTVDESAALTSQFSQSTAAQKTTNIVKDLPTEFTMSVLAEKGSEIVLYAFTNTSLTVNETLYKEYSASLNSEFTIVPNTDNALFIQGSAELTSTTDATATATRIKSATVNTDSVFSGLVVAAKVAKFFINCDVTTSIAANYVVTRYAESAITVDTTETAISEKIHSTATVITNTDTTMSVEGTTALTGEVHTNVTTDLIVDGTSSKEANAALTTTTTLACQADRQRGFAALVMSGGTLTAQTNVIRSGEANITAFAFELVAGEQIIGIVANLVSEFTLTAEIRDIDLEKYVYVIPRENRSWTIARENRTRVIKQETRIYKIRRY